MNSAGAPVLVVEKNVVVQRPDGVSFLMDVFWRLRPPSRPAVILFFHGFKAFREWGPWQLWARLLAEEGYVVVLPDLSHNGTTLENPWEITDMERFSRWTFSQDLQDVEAIRQWLEEQPAYLKQEVFRDTSEEHFTSISWIAGGHSRGGLLALICAHHYRSRIRAVFTLASPHAPFSTMTPEQIQQWKEKGVLEIENRRTGERYPYRYEVYEDVIQHADRYFPEQFAPQLSEVPILLLHGEADETVPVESAHYLHRYFARSTLYLYPGVNHTFGGKHPWIENDLPEPLERARKDVVAFLERLSFV